MSPQALPSATERRVLEAAKACCARWGIDKVTIDDIAAESGVSRATLNRMFPGGKDHRQKEHKTRFHEASDAGRRAGDRVHLARGVKETGPAALIGGGS